MGKKKRKFSDVDSGPSLPTPSAATSSSNFSRNLKYADLPEDQRMTWALTDDLSVLEQYNQLLDWIRHWGCVDGAEFEGIKSLNCVKGYPLVEVEVICRGKSAKFLISRASLYILAFYCGVHGWRCFKDLEFEIEGFTKMNRGAAYKNQPWENLGPKAMADALEMIESDIEEVASNGCEVFMVHLSEACRVEVIHSEIARTLMPSIADDWDPIHEDELELVGSGGLDILYLLKPIVVKLDACVAAPAQVRFFIKKYRELSKAWYVYALSKKNLFPLDRKLADDCGIRSIRSLRYSLSVLCSTNLDKVLYEWWGKLKRGVCPVQFTEDDFKVMESKVRSLQSQGKVFVSR